MSEQKLNHDYVPLKIAIIGDCGVGKTNLKLGMLGRDFTSFVTSTKEFEFDIIKTNLENPPNKQIKAEVYDISGGEKISNFLGISRQSNLHKTQLMFLVYDITNEQSFQDIRRWYKEVTESMNSNLNFVLIGNKCDMINQRVVEKERGQALADEYGIPFFETSAKTRLNIGEAFQKSLSDVYYRLYPDQNPVMAQSPLLVAPPAPINEPTRKWWQTLLLAIFSPIWILPYLIYRGLSSIAGKIKNWWERPAEQQPTTILQPIAPAPTPPALLQTNVQQQLAAAQIQTRAASSRAEEAESKARAQEAESKARVAETEVLRERQRARELERQLQELRAKEEKRAPQKDPLEAILEQLPAAIETSEKEQKSINDKIGEDVEIPKWMLCPISREIMTDPVTVKGSGQTYDRVSISRYFIQYHKKNDPNTGIVLSGSDFTLTPNSTTREAIEQWVKANTKKPAEQTSISKDTDYSDSDTSSASIPSIYHASTM